MKSIDLKKIPDTIIQKNGNYCIPASIETMVKYHDSSNNLSQNDIMTLMKNGASNGQPSFNAAQYYVTPKLKPKFELIQIITDTYEDWEVNIKEQINSGNPIAVSTRNKDGYTVHIRVVVGFDDIKRIFRLFNPGVSASIFNTTKRKIERIIQSDYEDYPYDEAKKDWSKQNGCRDQLIIK